MDKNRYTLTMPAEQRRVLEALAYVRKESPAEILRQILSEYASRNRPLIDSAIALHTIAEDWATSVQKELDHGFSDRL